MFQYHRHHHRCMNWVEYFLLHQIRHRRRRCQSALRQYNQYLHLPHCFHFHLLALKNRRDLIRLYFLNLRHLSHSPRRL
jgi:hypothetical protein